MKSIFVLLSLIAIQSTFAFTLISNPPAKFGVNEITVNAAGNDCGNIGMTAEDVLNLVEEAFDMYWNKVPTSPLMLKKGSVLSGVDVSSDTDVQATAKANVNTIIVGCSDGSNWATNPFDSTSTAGVGRISTSGGTRGGVLINNHSSSTVTNLSHAEMVTLVAHELGHTLGLHHSSDTAALMYYAIGNKVQEYLSQDDMDGITYLYPYEKSPTKSCGTIAQVDPDGGGTGMFILSLLLGVGFGLIPRKMKIRI